MTKNQNDQRQQSNSQGQQQRLKSQNEGKLYVNQKSVGRKVETKISHEGNDEIFRPNEYDFTKNDHFISHSQKPNASHDALEEISQQDERQLSIEEQGEIEKRTERAISKKDDGKIIPTEKQGKPKPTSAESIIYSHAGEPRKDLSKHGQAPDSNQL